MFLVRRSWTFPDEPAAPAVPPLPLPPCPQRLEAPLGCSWCRRVLGWPWVAPWSRQDPCPPTQPAGSKVVLPAPRGSCDEAGGWCFMLIQELVFQAWLLSAERPSSGEAGPLGGSWLPLFSLCTWLPAGGAALRAGELTTSSLWSWSTAHPPGASRCPRHSVLSPSGRKMLLVVLDGRPVPLLGGGLLLLFQSFPAFQQGAFETRQARVRVPLLPPASCVASGK